MKKDKIKFQESMQELSLPEDAIQYFLNIENTFEFENEEYADIQHIALYPFSNIQTIEIGISTCEYRVNHGINDDPNIDKDGYYNLQVVDLIEDVNDYESVGILVWIPEIKQFGTWDCDHGVLYVFKDISWSLVIKNIFTYVNTQWIYYGEMANKLKDQYQIHGIYDFCNPWEIWTFVEE